MGTRSSTLVRRGPVVFALVLGLAGGALAQAPTGAAPPVPAEGPERQAWDLKADALRDLQQGRYREGLAKAQEAARLREGALGPDHRDVAEALDLVGRLQERLGDYPAARATQERVLRIREAQGAVTADVGDTLGALAFVTHQIGDLAGARRLYERALRVREDVLGPDAVEVGESLNGLGLLLTELGDLAAARPALDRALTIREKASGPNHPRVAVVLANIGRLRREAGEYDGARAALDRALRIQERTLGPEHPDLGYTLVQLGFLHERLDDYAGARALFERALAIREKTLGPEHPTLAATLTSLALMLRAQGDFRGALPLVDRALRIQEKTLGPDHVLLGETLRTRGRIAQGLMNNTMARQDFERALRIQEKATSPSHPRVGLMLQNLGVVYWTTRDYPSAQTHLERSLVIFRSTGGYPEIHWRAARMLARLHERSGKRVEAAAAYREAAQVIRGLAASLEGRQSRAQYLDAADRLGVFDDLARVLLRLHERDASRGFEVEALAALEAKKSIIVASALAEAKPVIRDPQASRESRMVGDKRAETLRIERALQAEQAKVPGDQQAERVQRLTQELARTKTEYLAQVQAFLGRYPQYRTQFVDQQTVDPKAIAKFAERLPAGTLAVQYFATPDALYLFVVAPGGRFQVKTQAVSQKELYDLVRAYRTQLDRAAAHRLVWVDDGSADYRRDVVPLRDLTAKLSAHLLGPIEAELATHPNLIVFANDLLLYLPVHALTRKGADGSPRFLAETHVISQVTQLELVDLFSTPRASGGDSVLALANPDGSLPAASREVREVARVRGAVTALDGPDATKAQFVTLAGKFPALHLATHGVLDAERPDRSYLLLAGDDEASQRLTIGEIAGMSLAPNTLAILSGCETALGEQVPGAALVTLAAAFSQAGSQSIVASLWKVSDTATRDFMVALHRALAADGRAAALHAAQQSLLRNPATAHPYYWAAFVLLGAR